MHPTTASIDLAKDVFELAFADSPGKILQRKRLSRARLASEFENRPPMVVVMEACSSAHYWARRLTGLGLATVSPTQEPNPGAQRSVKRPAADSDRFIRIASPQVRLNE